LVFERQVQTITITTYLVVQRTAWIDIIFGK
jgi:hypothetical protein